MALTRSLSPCSKDALTAIPLCRIHRLLPTDLLRGHLDPPLLQHIIRFCLALHVRRRSHPCWTSFTDVSIYPFAHIRIVQNLSGAPQFLVLLSLTNGVVYCPLFCSTA